MEGSGPVIGELAASLQRLLPYLDACDVALTGSAAVHVHFAARGIPAPRPAGDVDFVARRLDAVSSRVAEIFLVSHFHRPRPGDPKFMVQLVDPVSRCRIDVFPDTAGAVEGAVRVDLGNGLRVRVLDAAAILDHKLATLARASQDRPVAEKHYQDALQLAALCAREVPAVPAAVLCKEEYSRDVSLVCGRCTESQDPAFPLAPKARILELLGYV